MTYLVIFQGEGDDEGKDDDKNDDGKNLNYIKINYAPFNCLLCLLLALFLRKLQIL